MHVRANKYTAISTGTQAGMQGFMHAHTHFSNIVQRYLTHTYLMNPPMSFEDNCRQLQLQLENVCLYLGDVTEKTHTVYGLSGLKQSRDSLHKKNGSSFGSVHSLIICVFAFISPKGK